MITLKLSTPKGELNISDEAMTIDDIKKYATTLGVPESKASFSTATPTTTTPTTTPTVTTQPAQRVTLADYMNDKTQPTTTPPSDDADDDVDNSDRPAKRVRTTYTCPNCDHNSITTVLEWFKFVKCGKCLTQIYLEPKDETLDIEDDGFEFIGRTPFFSFSERQAFKREQQQNYDDYGYEDDDDEENERSIKDHTVDVLDAITKSAKKSRSELDKYTMLELREFIHRTKLSCSNMGDKQAMIGAIYEDVKYGAW